MIRVRIEENAGVNIYTTISGILLVIITTKFRIIEVMNKIVKKSRSPLFARWTLSLLRNDSACNIIVIRPSCWFETKLNCL